MTDRRPPREPPPTRADYLHFQPIPTRWNDNDCYGHVNNVQYYAYFDTAVNCYLIAEGGLDIAADAVVGYIAESNCRYFSSVAYPDLLEVGLRIGTLGRSSVRYELALFRAGADTAAAQAWMVHVFVHRQTGTASAIPPRIRAALERLVPAPTPPFDPESESR